jgi:dipeptidyl aminopeptidase/acylaminoacyl peptidase
MSALPFGAWPSPISPADLTTAALRLSPGVVDGAVAYWAEGHPDQRGRVGLWRRNPDRSVEEVTPDAFVRTAVNEYGGGDWTARAGLIAYSAWPAGAVFLIDGHGPARQIAPGDGLRYAALSLDPRRRLLLAVREDHRAGGEPVQVVVALDLDSTNPEGGRVIAAGCDFYAHPSLSPDGRVAWCEWNHPDMAWDQASIVTASLSDPSQRTVVASNPGVSAVYPAWAPDGALVFLSDETGYWNFSRWVDGHVQAVHQHPADFCGPLWVLTPVPYAVIDSERIGCSWLEGGIAKVGVLAFGASGSTLTELPNTAVTAEVSGTGERCLAVLGYPDRPAELVELDWETGSTYTLRVSSQVSLPQEVVSRAQGLTWEAADGPVHAWYYPPTNGALSGAEGELPPVQVWSHGGPTAFSGPGFSLAVQFWTTRGIGILDVNYAGSSGYGRLYRDRLLGNWGITDVRDCVAGARALVAAGLADANRLSIRGSSAGGFTTLAALTTSNTFAAGISVYGIGDLEQLARDTHKFEAHYTDRLIAPYPSGRQVYLDRSPLRHVDQLSCPMLILQGADDKVVPPSQAEEMARAVQAKGLWARLKIFDGEGHGFRLAATIEAVAREALDFLAEVHRFTPAP